MAIYAVQEQGSDAVRLVEATSKTQAIGFVAKNRFSATTCKTKDIAAHMSAGVKLENANAQDARNELSQSEGMNGRKT